MHAAPSSRRTTKTRGRTAGGVPHDAQHKHKHKHTHPTQNAMKNAPDGDPAECYSGATPRVQCEVPAERCVALCDQAIVRVEDSVGSTTRGSGAMMNECVEGTTVPFPTSSACTACVPRTGASTATGHSHANSAAATRTDVMAQLGADHKAKATVDDDGSRERERKGEAFARFADGWLARADKARRARKSTCR
jgi:hypothetical protein